MPLPHLVTDSQAMSMLEAKYHGMFLMNTIEYTYIIYTRDHIQIYFDSCDQISDNYQGQERLRFTCR